VRRATCANGQALAGVALGQLGQVQPGAEVLALAVDHRGAYAGRQAVEGVADGQDQPSLRALRLAGRVRRITATLLVVTADVEMEVGIFFRHGGSCWANYDYEK
jgi:hypothetical protein